MDPRSPRERVFDAHHDDPEFGFRFMLEEARNAGQSMDERIAWQFCADNGWWSCFGKKKHYSKARVDAPAHDDLVGREFTAAGPNLVRLSDLTGYPTRERKLYPYAIKDVGSSRIVGYLSATG